MTHRTEDDRLAQGADGYDMTDALRRLAVDIAIDERELERPAA